MRERGLLRKEEKEYREKGDKSRISNEREEITGGEGKEESKGRRERDGTGTERVLGMEGKECSKGKTTTLDKLRISNRREE